MLNDVLPGTKPAKLLKVGLTLSPRQNHPWILQKVFLLVFDSIP